MLNFVMAIVDFIPVIAFLLGAIILQRDLYNKMSKGAFAVFSAGTIIVFVAGTLKAIYKLLKYSGVCLFEPLNQCFFPMQTVGFLLAGAGVLAMLVYNQGSNTAYSIAAPLMLLLFSTATNEYKGTMIFVVLMIIGVMLLDGSLIFIAAKRKNTLVMILYIISFVFVLGMGYLSTKEDLSDWYKEIVNIIGQGSFLLAAVQFRKSGLGETDAFKSFKK